MLSLIWTTGGRIGTEEEVARWTICDPTWEKLRHAIVKKLWKWISEVSLNNTNMKNHTYAHTYWKENMRIGGICGDAGKTNSTTIDTKKTEQQMTWFNCMDQQGCNLKWNSNRTWLEDLVGWCHPTYWLLRACHQSDAMLWFRTDVREDVGSINAN